MRLITTDNLILATILRLHNCGLVGIDKTDPRRAVFQFAETPLSQQLVTTFWNGTLSVEPRAFSSAQKDLKTMLYDRSYVQPLNG
jgi:hypothetical protein